MLAGNLFGLYNFITAKVALLEKFPSITEKNYWLFPFLSVLNITALFGMLYFKSWSPWLAMLGAIAVIAIDFYFDIHYHLFLAVPSSIILLYLIYYFSNHFNKIL